MVKNDNKCIISGASRFSEKARKYLEELGFTHFYELRDQEGDEFSVEEHVMVNNIGCIATNFEIQERDPVTGNIFLMDEDLYKIYRARCADDEVDYSKL